MESYQMIEYKPTFPLGEAGKFFYEYQKKKSESVSDKYSGAGLDDVLKSDERTLLEEVESIDFQIAEREKIKQRNVRFLEDQRRKLEGFLNQTECFTYKPSGVLNAVRGKLATQLVMVEMKKGDEYVNAFRDVQRLEEEKRKLLGEAKADEGWLE